MNDENIENGILNAATGMSKLESMSSIKEELVSPAKQLNNKYFVNRIQSNTTVDPIGILDVTTMAPSITIKANKYFVNNVSLMSKEIMMGSNSSTSSTSTKTNSETVKSIPSNTKPTNATSIAKKTQNKVNGSISSGRLASSHFQIAQKQLILSKNSRTEPPPMLNHILDSLSVSNSKHLHHDHRFVECLLIQ